MTNQTETRKGKKLVLGLAILAAAVIIGLVAAKIILENKIKAWATEDLSLYEPLIKFESGTVEASLFGASVTYKDLVYSLPDVEELKIVIDRATSSGLDWDTLLGNPGDVSSMEKISMTGLRVLMEGYEQPVLELGGSETADVVLPYRDIRAALLANRDSGDVKGLLKALLPVVQNNAARSGASSARDLKMNMRQVGLFDLYLGSATASGIRALNKEADGYDTALDNLAYNNFKLTGEDFRGSEWQASLDAFEIKGLKYNYRELIAALSGIDEQSDPFELLSSVLPSLYDYRYDGMSADKLAVNFDGGVFTLDKIQLGPRTLKEQGPNVVSNLKVALGGMDVFSLEAIGMDKLVLSDVIADFMTRPDYYFNNMEIVAKYEEDPLQALQGLRLDNLYVKNLDAQGMVKLDNWRADVSVADSLKVGSRISKLYLSVIALRQAAMFADPDMRDLIDILAMNPDGLTLDSGLDLDLDIKPGALGYGLVFDAAAQKQGKIAVRTNGVTAEPMYEWETYGPPLFEALELSLEDEGFLHNVFEFMAGEGLADDAASARASLAADLDEAMQNAGPNEVRLAQGVKTFLLNGGGLKIGVASGDPDFAPAFDRLFDSLDEMEISVSNDPLAPAVSADPSGAGS